MLSFSKSAFCLLFASPLIAVVIATGCSDTANTGTTPGSTTASTESSSGSAGGGGGTSSGTAGGGGWMGIDGGFVIAECQGKTYQCGDTMDNDNDGLVDWQDPDCLGPCDNSENGLQLNIPGGDGPACFLDCYWDGNSGTGNDGCFWNHECDTLDPEGAACTVDTNAKTPGTPLSCQELLEHQPASCLAVCPQLVPNGCDCFGCCVLYKGGVEYGPVWLGTIDPNTKQNTCKMTELGTPNQDTACAPCTQVQNECFNGCGRCELCIGKGPEDLPPDCFPPPDGGPPPPDGGPPPPDGGPPPPQCTDGMQPCGLPGQALCPIGSYCLTGCCIQAPP